MPYSIGELQGNLIRGTISHYLLVDVESIQKINSIVEKEFHREITIRTQELEIIEQRIEEAENLLLKLDRVAQLSLINYFSSVSITYFISCWCS